MQVILNKQGYVEAYALVGEFSTSSVTVNEPENLSDFEENYRSYYLSNGNMLIKSDDKQNEMNNERELVALRNMRKKVCFPYINRGELWYGTLTENQKEELNAWYHAWLDITETRMAPVAPEWLM